MYEVEIANSAAKEIIRLQRPEQKRVMAAITDLGTDPRPNGVTKLSGEKDAYRVRVGTFRIVYTIDDGIRVVRVTRVGHRKEVYRK